MAAVRTGASRRRPTYRALLATAVVLLITAAVAACGSDAHTGAAASHLKGRAYLSAAVDGYSLVPGTQIELSFDQRELRARAGCNSISAAYTVGGGRLVVSGGLSATEMGCDPPRQAQDQWLVGFLQDTPRLELQGDALTLTTGAAALHLIDAAVAHPDRPLLGTRWRLDTVLTDDTASSVPPTHPVTIEFEQDATLIADSAGCTSVRVPVTVDTAAGMLRFGPFAIDTIGCPPPWEAVVAVLRAPQTRYSITGSRLTITTTDRGLAAAAE